MLATLFVNVAPIIVEAVGNLNEELSKLIIKRKKSETTKILCSVDTGDTDRDIQPAKEL